MRNLSTTTTEACPPSGDPAVGGPLGMTRPRRAARLVALPAVPLIVYFLVRPSVASDAAGLAIAGAVPVSYTIAFTLIRRRLDRWAVFTSVGFAISCIVSLLAGGSALPLKLHEAAVTFVLGVVLLCAALARRPLPVGRVLKVAHSDRSLDLALGAMIGSFLVLHALLHLALALTLSTESYLTVGRVVDWATIGVGAACLYSYLRRLRRDPHRGWRDAGDQARRGGRPMMSGRPRVSDDHRRGRAQGGALGRGRSS